MDTVLITGGSGFLGRAVAARLKRRYRVVGLDIRTPEDAEIETIKTDLTCEESVREGLARAMKEADGPLASVVHLAAYFDLTGEDNPLYRAITVEGSRRLVRALERHHPEQIILASTLLVHEATEPGRKIDEGWPLDPEWAYPRSKVEAERVLANEAGYTRTVVLRPAGIYDENCRAAFLAQQIARIYERLLTSRLYAGDPSVGQPFLHVADFADAVERAVERRRELPIHATYLLGETYTPSYDLLQDRIGALIHGEDWDTVGVPRRLAKVGAWMQEEVLDQDPFVKPWMIDISGDHYEIDVRRARRDLGWFPSRSVLQTLPEMIARLRADPPRWYALNDLEGAKVAARGGALRRAAEHAREVKRDRDAARALAAGLAQERERTRWAHLVNVALGAWLVASPWAYGLFDPVLAPPPPAAGAPLPEAEIRNTRLAFSEIASGVAVMALALLSIGARRGWAQWSLAAVGLWVMFAPLLFWTSNPAAYNLDTLIGTLLIVLAVMIPPPPGVSSAARRSNADIPLGWTYSPSTYVQRIPIVALAFLGFFVSRYLTAYQLGHTDGLADPFFAGRGGLNGSEDVVTSWVSREFFIADAGLGAAAYILDILTGSIGGRARWRTMPWMVLIFGLLIIPLGAVSVGFIIIQPTLIGALCSLCLFQAVITVLLIPFAIDEVIASGQYLWQAKRSGLSFWSTLWTGGPPLQEGRDPSLDLNQSALSFVREFVEGGVNYPWTLVLAALLGAGLLTTPLTLGAEGELYFSDHIAGCLVFTVAITAWAEVARAARLLIAPLGLWVAISPFALAGADWLSLAAHPIIGLALVALSLPRGARSDTRYGAWERFIA